MNLNMKYKYFFLLFFLFSCSSGSTQNKKSSFIPYSAKGFAMIYKEIDYDNKSVLDCAHTVLDRPVWQGASGNDNNIFT